MKGDQIIIRSVQSKADLQSFIRVPWLLYKDDPNWVPPLKSNLLSTLDRKKNPFYDHADVTLLLAERSKTLVGRISAHVDQQHNEFHKENIGFFGFFEAADQDVANALLDKAASVLTEKGVDAIRGPMSFSSNEEIGLLVDGFEHPPYFMMGHNPAIYKDWLEQAGFAKAKDVFAWKYAVGDIPEHVLQIAENARSMPGLKIRPINMAKMEQEIKIVFGVFNAAWSRNWGYVPFTEAEITEAAKGLKMILDPNLALIAEVDGVPAAISIAFPNLNEAIKDLNGNLFPFGVFKLLYRLKRRKITSARLALLGVRPEFRGSRGMGLSVLLYCEMNKMGALGGYREGELSWTLEDNEKINAGIELMGGQHYKTYRIFEKGLK